MGGPLMNYGRYKHGCVSFEDKERNKKVMVIGSKSPSVASSTAELFDGDSWTVLDDLPVGIAYAKTVAYKSKVIVTGQDYSTDDPLPFAWVLILRHKLGALISRWFLPFMRTIHFWFRNHCVNK